MKTDCLFYHLAEGVARWVKRKRTWGVGGEGEMNESEGGEEEGESGGELGEEGKWARHGDAALPYVTPS